MERSPFPYPPDWEEWLARNRGLLKCHPRTQRAQFQQVVEQLDRGEPEWGDGSGPELREFPPPPFRQREVYFGKLTPSSKTRPFLILQNDYLNRAVVEGLYSTILVAPLSGQLLGGDYRLPIGERGLLTRKSEVVLSAIGPVAADRLLWERGVATRLTQSEWEELQVRLNRLLGF